jgi:hypothetical protein
MTDINFRTGAEAIKPVSPAGVTKKPKPAPKPATKPSKGNPLGLEGL